MYEVETIQIDEDNRIVVHYDEGSEDPREWGWDEKVYELNYRYGFEADNHDRDPVIDVFNQVYDRTADLDKAMRAMSLWMSLGDDTRVVRIVDVHVYRDTYNYLVIGESQDSIGSFMDVFSRWLQGEVYIVVHEKREQWTNADETAEMDTWEWEDSIGGCYLDDEYTAEVAARENFEIELTQKVEK